MTKYKEEKKMAKKSTKLEALQKVFQENAVSLDSIECNDILIQKIKKNADAIPDYRHPSYVKHHLGDILMIVFFAMLGNANEWKEIESFAKKKEAWLRKYLELPFGIPTDDTYRIVMGMIAIESFFHTTVQLLITTVDGMLTLAGKEDTIYEKGITAIDGKESRGSRRNGGNGVEGKALQTLNVYSADYGICIEQKFIEEKTNEIPAAQEVLSLMDLSKTIVTADAMNCQKDTAAVIIKQKGEYVLALKGNQPLFYEEVKNFFDKEQKEELKKKETCYKKTTELEQGGLVIREYYITEDVDWYSEKKKWKKLKSFGMVQKTVRKKDGSEKKEGRYYICSIDEDVEEFARAVREHWRVENNLHWQLDVTFQDDKNKSMAKTGAKNLQMMKKLALAILQLIKESYKKSMKLIRYELSLDYENEVEKILSILDIGNIEKVLQSVEKSFQK